MLNKNPSAGFIRNHFVLRPKTGFIQPGGCKTGAKLEIIGK